MQLVVITPENDVPRELAVVNALFSAGLRRLHLRKPTYEEAVCERYLAQVEQQYHDRIVLCNNFHLYHQWRLGGIHLNSAMREDAVVWASIKDVPGSAMSTSFHTWDEVLANEARYGYVFISPVFDSISKAGYKAAIALDGIRDVKAAGGPLVYGLGGVNRETLPQLIAHGFDGAALLGTIWNAPDPVAAYKEIADLIG